MISKYLCFSYDSLLDVMVEQIPRRKRRPREGANRAKHDRPSAPVSEKVLKYYNENSHIPSFVLTVRSLLRIRLMSNSGRYLISGCSKINPLKLETN